jgi:hypothetical protein
MKPSLLILVAAGVLFAQAPVRVDRYEASAHVLPSEAFVRVPKPEIFDSVRFELRVNELGRVADAKPVSGKPEYFAAAESVVRRRQYRPFLRNDQPVEAIVEAWISVLPPEIRPTTHRAFPEVKDWNSVRISLVRTYCFGSCPSYEVEIRGDGSVTYTGKGYVAVSGIHKGNISRKAVESLVALFRDADFYSFEPKYTVNVSDNPTYTTSISIDGQTHSVIDYMGSAAGMPLVIGRLENAVDEYSGTDRWVRGNRETVPALRAEGFDFKSEAAGFVLKAAAGRGEVGAVRDLIQAGAPLDVKGMEMFNVGAPLRAAVTNPDPEVIRLLIEAGASKNDAATKNDAAEEARRIDRHDILAMLRQ